MSVCCSRLGPMHGDLSTSGTVLLDDQGSLQCSYQTRPFKI